MPKAVNITNQRFGRLVALHPTHKRDPDGNILWFCRCDCGQYHSTPAHDLRRGLVRSCGCRQRNYKHGHCRTGKYHPLYGTWNTMLQRCYNPKCVKYKYYGALGVQVCKRWRTSFENFLADVGERPHSGLTLDRINNNGNYTPSNVRWATHKEQRANRRDSK